MKTKLVVECDYSEIEALAEKHYGAKGYSFVAVQECGNDSSHSFRVSNKMGKKEAEQIRKGKIPNYHNGDLLNCLCADGFIEAGDYVVKVCW
jgi:hypothetical protein